MNQRDRLTVLAATTVAVCTVLALGILGYILLFENNEVALTTMQNAGMLGLGALAGYGLKRD